MERDFRFADVPRSVTVIATPREANVNISERRKIREQVESPVYRWRKVAFWVLDLVPDCTRELIIKIPRVSFHSKLSPVETVPAGRPRIKGSEDAAGRNKEKNARSPSREIGRAHV